MPGVEQPNVIDLVAREANGRYVLVMVETRRWGSDPNQPSQLREKLNAYASYILDGAVARQDPAAEGQPVDIQLECVEVPSGIFATILELVGPRLQQLSIGLRVKVRAAPPTA